MSKIHQDVTDVQHPIPILLRAARCVIPEKRVVYPKPIYGRVDSQFM